MKQEIFLSTGNKDIYDYELEPVKSYLEKRGFIVDDIVTHGRDCIRVVLDSDNEQIIDSLIKALHANIINILEHEPNNYLSDILDIKETQKILEPFSDTTDITQKEFQKISKAKEILQSLNLPIENIPFYAGEISIQEENSIYTISLYSNKKYIHDSDEYSIKFQWIFSPETHNYKTKSIILRNGKEETVNDYFNWKNKKEVKKEIYSLERMDFFKILNYIQEEKEYISEDLFFAPEKVLQEESEQVEEYIFPIDTIIKTDHIPNWSIVKELKFSSFYKLREQLNQWNIPYQVIHFSKGKQFLKSLSEFSEPQSQIKIIVQKKGKSEFREYFIVKRESEGEYFIPEHQDEQFSFSGTFGSIKNGDIIFSPFNNNFDSTRKVIKNDGAEKEIYLPSKAIVRINCPDISSIQDSIEIDGNSFILTNEQKTKLNLSKITDNFDEIRGNPSGFITSRSIEVHFEFPVDNELGAILKDIRVIAYKDVFKNIEFLQ